MTFKEKVIWPLVVTIIGGIVVLHYENYINGLLGFNSKPKSELKSITDENKPHTPSTSSQKSFMRTGLSLSEIEIISTHFELEETLPVNGESAWIGKLNSQALKNITNMYENSKTPQIRNPLKILDHVYIEVEGPIHDLTSLRLFLLNYQEPYYDHMTYIESLFKKVFLIKFLSDVGYSPQPEAFLKLYEKLLSNENPSVPIDLGNRIVQLNYIVDSKTLKVSVFARSK